MGAGKGVTRIVTNSASGGRGVTRVVKLQTPLVAGGRGVTTVVTNSASGGTVGGNNSCYKLSKLG